MINVISSEFYKILRSRIFYIMSGILLFFNIVVFGRQVYEKYFSTKNLMTATGIEDFQSAFASDFVFFIIAIFTAYIITSEYNNKSIRQMACHGIARWKLVLGQYIAISCMATIIMLVFGLLSFLTGTIFCGAGSVDIEVLARMTVGLICMFWGTSAVAALLSYICKNGVLTIVLLMILIVGNNIGLSILAEITKNDDIAMYSLNTMRKVIINFNSDPNAVMNFSVVFLAIAVISMIISGILFTKEDIH